jgi:LmbE family N-acetylglucosaminyl deacetylase
MKKARRLLKRYYMLRDFFNISSKTCSYHTDYNIINDRDIKKYDDAFTSGFKIFTDTKCLLLSPHPDDEIIGCGGLLIKFAKNFNVLCLATSGMVRAGQSPQENSKTRMEDFYDIMRQIGINRFYIFEYWENGRCFEFYKNMINEYIKCVNVSNYDYIFLPHKKDNHPDHQYVSELLQNMITMQGCKKTLQLIHYEVWSPLENPNAYIDISDAIYLKGNYLKKYRTVGNGYIEPIRGLNMYRGMSLTLWKHPYVEAFEVTGV